MVMGFLNTGPTDDDRVPPSSPEFGARRRECLLPNRIDDLESDRDPAKAFPAETEANSPADNVMFEKVLALEIRVVFGYLYL